MCDRIKAAVDARYDDNFQIMARTDSIASESIESAIERCQKYVESGADMLFPEAITELSMYEKFSLSFDVPILANITEFGKTPLFSVVDLEKAGVSISLYPLSAFRAMNKAALNVYESVKKSGTQNECVDQMQTRNELYDFLNYHEYEKKLDTLNK